MRFDQRLTINGKRTPKSCEFGKSCADRCGTSLPFTSLSVLLSIHFLSVSFEGGSNNICLRVSKDEVCEKYKCDFVILFYALPPQPEKKRNQPTTRNNNNNFFSLIYFITLRVSHSFSSSWSQISEISALHLRLEISQRYLFLLDSMKCGKLIGGKAVPYMDLRDVLPLLFWCCSSLF